METNIRKQREKAKQGKLCNLDNNKNSASTKAPAIVLGKYIITIILSYILLY
jgi:hypothetical protein